ncbi:MAG: hypothetical protein PHI27_00210 [Eubacteriales bacterium]|nr:hypothetical protein [Eubacteriales bacterium]MDD4511700.1 hypothetical protein [Eubacteriales bacterium]
MAAVFTALLRIAFKAIAAVSTGRDDRRFLGQLLPVPVPPVRTAFVGTEPLWLAVFLPGKGLSALSTVTELCTVCLLWQRLDALALAEGFDGVLR